MIRQQGVNQSRNLASVRNASMKSPYETGRPSFESVNRRPPAHFSSAHFSSLALHMSNILVIAIKESGEPF